jgi:arsenite/tail-anchored protein-transporting ATPase
VLGHEVGARDTRLEFAPNVAARLLDASELRAAFMERWGPVIASILDRGTYLDDTDIGPLVDTALPGGDEIFAALELGRLMAELGEAGSDGSSAARAPAPQSTASPRLVVDTAPTGHTLRLLALPATFRALVRLLDAMQEKHRFMVRTLTRRYRSDIADEFLIEMRNRVDVLDVTLRDARECAAVLVTNAQPVVQAESRRYFESLRGMGIHVAAVVWNAEERVSASDTFSDTPQWTTARLDPPPAGSEGLERWWSALQPVPAVGGSAGGSHAAPSRPRFGGASHDPGSRPVSASWLPPLTIVAGKGGVGKTTVACALAFVAAEQFRTLVVSTDPAPSLSDALDQPVPDTETPVDAAKRLHARQMDATAAFERLRAEYTGRVDALFAAITDRGVGLRLEHDHAITRDLLELAPPGVDEVYALTLLADALGDGRFERVIVDPAPTGHLLRLLEMPQLALSWTHQLMRLMLKYKDVTGGGLGDTASELLDLSRGLRAVDELFRDPVRCGLVLVTLNEPVVRAESERLERAAAERGVRVRGVIHNRSAGPSLPVGAAEMQVVAPAAREPLVGADAIRRWSAQWALLAAAHPPARGRDRAAHE